MTWADDLIAKVASLEGRLNDLKVEDLPLGALQRKLEATWQPDGNDLIAPGSLELSALNGVVISDVVVTWPGGSGVSNTLTVNHGLPSTPRRVDPVTQDQANIGPAAAYVVAKGPTQYQIKVATFNGFQPGGTTTTLVSVTLIA